MGKLTIKRHVPSRKGLKSSNMLEIWEDGYLGAVINEEFILPSLDLEQENRLDEGEEIHFKLVEVE